MLFELITGDYLFDPKKGKTYKKNDDHLALMTELIGEMRGDQLNYMKDSCEGWDDFYMATNKNQTCYKLKRIKNLKVWPLFNVLTEKYKMKEVEATLLSKFLNRMLQWSPKARASARDLLNDPWLKVGELDENTFMTKGYFKEWKKAVCGDDENEDSSSKSSNSSNDEDSISKSDESSEESQSQEEDAQQDEEDSAESNEPSLLQTIPDVTGLNYRDSDITFVENTQGENAFLVQTQSDLSSTILSTWQQ